VNRIKRLDGMKANIREPWRHRRRIHSESLAEQERDIADANESAKCKS
jgi:hypothetical protein